jgi:hypothetical protein
MAAAFAAAPALSGAQLSAPVPVAPTPPASSMALATDSTAPAATPAVGPVLRSSAVRVHTARPATALGANAALMATSRTQSRAMMVVGAAALITGAIIGGDPGTIVMVGGAVVGLIGLYDYLQ